MTWLRYQIKSRVLIGPRTVGLKCPLRLALLYANPIVRNLYHAPLLVPPMEILIVSTLNIIDSERDLRDNPA